MSNHIETVSKIYEAFGKGDIPAILSHLDNEVRWEEWSNNTGQEAGVPWLKSRKGKDGAAEFFKMIGEMKFMEFDIKSLMEGPNQVAAEIVVAAEIPSTGASFRDEEIQLWTFNDAGKVIRLRHYLDTAKHIKTANVESVG